MTDDPDDDEGLLIGLIVIERRLLADGTDVVLTRATTGGEEGLEAVVALGMLRLAEGSVLHDQHEDDDDE